jgi:carbon-monoxide dehydrogenase medium subunit
MGGEVLVRSASGERVIAAADFFTGPFSTAIGDDEILVESRFPVWPDGTGYSFAEMTRLYNGFPVAGAAALIQISDGIVQRVGLAMCGVAGTSVASDAGESLVGRSPSDDALAEVAEAAVAGLDPPADVHGGSEYRRGVARSCVRRALHTAVSRAGGGS